MLAGVFRYNYRNPEYQGKEKEDHAVALVGWGTEILANKTEIEYWLVRCAFCVGAQCGLLVEDGGATQQASRQLSTKVCHHRVVILIALECCILKLIADR